MKPSYPQNPTIFSRGSTSDLQNQFTKEMNWDNYGIYWNIDHRIPTSWFHFNEMDSEGFRKCWALENLQPLLEEENRAKFNKRADTNLSQVFIFQEASS